MYRLCLEAFYHVHGHLWKKFWKDKLNFIVPNFIFWKIQISILNVDRVPKPRTQITYQNTVTVAILIKSKRWKLIKIVSYLVKL